MTSTPPRPAAFLDRDGILNEDYGYIGQIERFTWRPSARETVKWLNDRGFLVFIVTNQAGVARGLFDATAVERIHAHMRNELSEIDAHIDDIRFCPHHPEGTVAEYAAACSWRKPGPGMVLDLLKHWSVDLTRSFMLGDKESDVAAGEAAGVRSFRVGRDENLFDTVTRIAAAIQG